MSNPISLNFSQGETVSFPVVMTDPDGITPTDLTGSIITGDIRKEYVTDVVASFTVVATDLVNGSFSINLPSSVTEALPMNTKGRITSFVFDVDIKYTDNSIDTPISGYLKVTRQVTANV